MKAITQKNSDNVVLKIISTQTMHEETTVTELKTTGLLQELQPNVHTLTFHETFGEGSEKCTVNSKITVHKNGSLSLERTGLYAVHFVFEECRRYNSAYTTPYGTLDLGVYTKEARFLKRDENHALIKLQYTLDSGAEIFTENTMKIIIKKRNEYT